jgi:hypothetical protein
MVVLVQTHIFDLLTDTTDSCFMKLAVHIIIFVSLLCSVHSHLRETRRDQEEVHVFIAPKNENGLGVISKAAKLIRPKFKKVDTIKAIVTRAKLEELQNDPDILYVEEDGWVYEDGEADLYGLEMVQADSPLIPTDIASSAACNDPNSFKIGVSAKYIFSLLPEKF